MRSWQHNCYVLCQIWAKPITTKSDKARDWADTLAWAVARRYLTTEIAPWSKEYGNLYKVTAKGLSLIEDTLDGLDRESILDIVHGKLDEEDGEQPGTFRLD